MIKLFLNGENYKTGFFLLLSYLYNKIKCRSFENVPFLYDVMSFEIKLIVLLRIQENTFTYIVFTVYLYKY